MPGDDWRSDAMSTIRALINEVDPDVVEEAKWVKASNPAGVPAWSHDGLICTGETYKDTIKLTFFHGAALDDPDRLFNSSLDAGTRRAIDITDGAMPDRRALKALIGRAVALNVERAAPKRRT